MIKYDNFDGTKDKYIMYKDQDYDSFQPHYSHTYVEC